MAVLIYRYVSACVGGPIKVTIVVTPDKLFIFPYKCAVK